MIQSIYSTFLKLLREELALSPAPARAPKTLDTAPTTTTTSETHQPAQVAGIDANRDQLHMDDGRIFEITVYKDPYGKVCEAEDACAVEASNGDSKIKVEFYSSRYTLH